jgi:hypothetical protein
MTASVRRQRWTLGVALIAAVVAITGVVGLGSAASAAPLGRAPTPTAPGDEGGTPLIRDVITKASQGYADAKQAVDKSQKRQLQLQLELTKAETKIKEMEPEVALIASASYRSGRISAFSMLLNSSSPDTFLDRAMTLDLLAQRDNAKIATLKEAHDLAKRANDAIDAELAEQQKQMGLMAKQKREAEIALKQVGGQSTGGFVVASSPKANPAPRNSDGGFSGQSCNTKDPTNPGSGCITARTLHMYNETRRLVPGAKQRFVNCYRSGGPYEHPKGRACDWSSERGSFGGDARGADKTYGNNLAAFYVRNADRLGIMYVIWYRQFWSPATGWKYYSGSGGDPSSDHTNHVHVSML